MMGAHFHHYEVRCALAESCFRPFGSVKVRGCSILPFPLTLIETSRTWLIHDVLRQTAY
jgi:hypothetical protein